MSSVRFICGTHALHKQLEARIAQFHGMPDAILFPSCFDANAGIFEALLTKEDAIISDSLNHASIIDGIRLCKAQRHLYKHSDMADLEQKLRDAAGARVRLIVTDGAFSMDGDVAPLREIVALSKKHDAFVFIDECHATGFFGATGRGTPEYWGLQPGDVHIINSTLGKALGGGTGGYTAASAEIVDLLRQRARPYLFSNAITPSTAAAGLAVFDLLERDAAGYAAKLRGLAHRFRDGMAAAGFKILGARDHPICPVLLGDPRVATQMATELLAEGLYVIAFSFPVVPRGQDRIRTQMSAAHSEADIDFAVAAFTRVGKRMGVIA
jgi:glycine C-acetyltransferase